MTITERCVKFSVIVPISGSFRRTKILPNILLSILNQTYNPRDIILVADETAYEHINNFVHAQLKKFKKNKNCETMDIKIIRAPRNCGPSFARNLGVEFAGGNIVAFLDSDDIWHPRYLEILSAYYSCGSKVSCSLAFSSFKEMIVSRSPIDVVPLVLHGTDSDCFLALIIKNFIHTVSSFSIQREAFLQLGGFREDLFQSEDLEFYLRLSRYYKIDIVQLFLVQRLLGTDNITYNLRSWANNILRVHLGLLKAKNISKDMRRLLSYGLLTRIFRLIKKQYFPISRKLGVMKMLPKIFALFILYGGLSFILSSAFWELKSRLVDAWRRYEVSLLKNILAVKKEKVLVDICGDLMPIKIMFYDVPFLRQLGLAFRRLGWFVIGMPWSISKDRDDRLPISLVAAENYENSVMFLRRPQNSVLYCLLQDLDFAVVTNHELLKILRSRCNMNVIAKYPIPNFNSRYLYFLTSEENKSAEFNMLINIVRQSFKSLCSDRVKMHE